MRSSDDWNAEVRQGGGAEKEVADLPVWTPEEGGCEGMKILSKDNTSTGAAGIPLDDALKQLPLYEIADRRLPRDA